MYLSMHVSGCLNRHYGNHPRVLFFLQHTTVYHLIHLIRRPATVLYLPHLSCSPTAYATRTTDHEALHRHHPSIHSLAS
jgi:hypothetical protein